MPLDIKYLKDAKTRRRTMLGLMRLDGAEIEVGFHDAESARVAAIQHFGTSTIPARPFMSQALQDGEAAYLARMGGVTRQALAGAPPRYDRIGEAVVKGVQAAIDGWTAPPNAPSTVARKGKNSPLVDTGAMRNAVTYEVYDGGGGDA